MSYIALQILDASGDAISESHLKFLLSHVEEGVMQSEQEDNDVPSQGAHQETPPAKNPDLALYVTEFKATIVRYRGSILQLLQTSPASAPLPDLSVSYDKLRRHYFPIISGLATLITHLGGKTISSENIDKFTQQAKTDALVLHTTTIPATPAPLLP